MMIIIYNNCVMYRPQHNDGREGEVGKRRRRERVGDKEGVEVKRMKEEEREGTKVERKITFWSLRGNGREREKERKGEREREGGRERGKEGASKEKENGGERKRAVKGRRRE